MYIRTTMEMSQAKACFTFSPLHHLHLYSSQPFFNISFSSPSSFPSLIYQTLISCQSLNLSSPLLLLKCFILLLYYHIRFCYHKNHRSHSFLTIRLTFSLHPPVSSSPVTAIDPTFLVFITAIISLTDPVVQYLYVQNVLYSI